MIYGNWVLHPLLHVLRFLSHSSMQVTFIYILLNPIILFQSFNQFSHSIPLSKFYVENPNYNNLYKSMDVVGIVVSVVVFIILVAVSFYLFAVYCHPEDKGIGSSLVSKILIIFCQALAWGQLLLIPLDVQNSFGVDQLNSVMYIVYSVVYIIIFALAAWIIPFAIFIYESDEESSWVSRICWSILFAFGIAAIWCAFVFISYIWLSYYTNEDVTEQLPVSMYIMTCLSLIGWIFLSINGGIGLIFLPFELILYFFNRPKKLTKEEAIEKKKLIQKSSTELIDAGENLKKKEQQLRNSDGGWFSKRKLQSEVKSSLQYYKQQVNKLEENDKLFQEQLKKKQVHPISYCVSLFFGILATVVSIAWMIQLIGTSIRTNSVPVYTFLDEPLLSLSEGNLNFLSVGLYSLLVLYLQGCAVKGNLVFGIRIPFIINFHPMKPNKTYLNSFLFNVNMMMLSSVATTQLTILAFPSYLQNSYLGQLFDVAILNLPMFGWLYTNRIFMGILVIVSFMSIFAMIYKIVTVCCSKNKQHAK